MKRAAIYRRVSTVSQEDNTSLEGQLAACKLYAEKNNLQVVADFYDTASGEGLNRPGFKQLMALIEQRGIEAVIVYHQDRLSRNLIDTLQLMQQFANLGVELHDTTQGEIRDSLLSTIVAVVAAEERKNLGRRMRKGVQDKMRQGKIPGQGDKPPYGYRFEGQGKHKTLVVNEEEAEIVRLIFRWYVEDTVSIRAIAMRLTEQRIPTPRDNGRNISVSQEYNTRSYGQWNPSTVAVVLRNTAYKGLIYANRYIYQKRQDAPPGKNLWKRIGERPQHEWIILNVPAIVSEVLWERAQPRLATGKLMAPRNTKREYLLRCRVRCSCGYTMHGVFPHTMAYYRCDANRKDAVKHCRAPVVRAERLEQIAWDWLKEALTPEKLMAGLQREQEQVNAKRDELLAQLAMLESQLKDFAAQLTRIEDAYERGGYNYDKMIERRSTVEMARRAVETEIQFINEKLSNAGPSAEEAAELLAQVTALHAELGHVETFEERRWFIDRLDVHAKLEIDEAGKRWVRFTGRLALEGRAEVDAIVSTGF